MTNEQLGIMIDKAMVSNEMLTNHDWDDESRGILLTEIDIRIRTIVRMAFSAGLDSHEMRLCLDNIMFDIEEGTLE